LAEVVLYNPNTDTTILRNKVWSKILGNSGKLLLKVYRPGRLNPRQYRAHRKRTKGFDGNINQHYHAFAIGTLLEFIYFFDRCGVCGVATNAPN
jgi:hypothetical protein